MALTVNETQFVNGLYSASTSQATTDETLSRYYEGSQRLAHIGLAVPPELRKFETVVNWSRVAVDSVEQRLQLRGFTLPGQDRVDESLREVWDANNLDSESSLLHKDTLIYGRGFVCVGTNPDSADHPLITVESPRELTVDVDPRTRRIRAALRLYGHDETDLRPKYATLYRPDATVWLTRDGARWVETDRDDHKLGRVPIVMFLNRRRTGQWAGVSEMTDVIPLVDAAARSLTNLQIAAETHSVPQKYVLGMSKGDFVDQNGNPIPAWESYFSAIWANANNEAKVGQFTASDLKNFHDTVNHYGQLVASVTGLPTRYLGQSSVNPAAEGAIRADEARLVLNAEGKASNLGDGWGWAMGIAERLRTGTWPEANRIKASWFDAGTPTFAQKADALQKLHGGGPMISREGAWDELGWSEARKDTERGYFDKESQFMVSALEKDVSEVS